jgi:hypothetical protein
MDQAKTKLEEIGFTVTACPEPTWAVDLLEQGRVFDLAAVSSEIDASTQAEILRVVKAHRRPPRLMLLLDALDTATVVYQREGQLCTHRLSEDLDAFVRAVVDQIGAPPHPK